MIRPMKLAKMLYQKRLARPVILPDLVVQISPHDYQAYADKCRDKQLWSEAAYYYRKVVGKDPKNLAIWIQQGHMLKEVGLLTHAVACYRRAIEIESTDPEAFVQLAIVYKQQGEFDQAITCYEAALKLDYQDKVFLCQEIEFLKKTANRSIESLFSSGEASSYRVYLSSVSTTPSEENTDKLSLSLGKTHYSYGFILKGYIQALKSLGIPFEFISSPEYIANIKDRSSAKINIHIGIYPPDGPRLLKGAYNIFVFAWEFERLQYGYERISNHAFVDSKTMLSIADEVWGISQFTSSVAVKAGILQVRTVPTPIVQGICNRGRSGLPLRNEIYNAVSRLEHIHWRPLAISSVMQSVLSKQSSQREQTLRRILIDTYDDGPPIFYLTIFNVYDYRKQIKPALEGFIQFSKRHSNVFFLIKLSIAGGSGIDPNISLFANQIADPAEISAPLVSDRIWITTDTLSREDLNVLYDITSFYTSTSHGEGQNLPLLEAMGRGVVPLSVNHTAMADYVFDDNAIIVPSTFAPFNIRLIDRYRMYNVNTYYVSSRDMLLALERTFACDVESYSIKSQKCVDIVIEKYGIESFKTSINDLIEKITKDLSSEVDQ